MQSAPIIEARVMISERMMDDNTKVLKGCT